MPAVETVKPLGWGRFVVYSNDHPPPHVHCILNDGMNYRIDLRSGCFMDIEPPPGMSKRIMKAYLENVVRIWTEWEKYHPPVAE